jgi:hypothetical protein
MILVLYDNSPEVVFARAQILGAMKGLSSMPNSLRIELRGVVIADNGT